MKQSRVVVVLLLVVACVAVFKVGIAPFLANLQAKRLAESRKNQRTRSFSALQPYSYIKIDSTPRKPWVRTDFRFGWLSPEALSNTALNYSFLPQLYGFEEDDWRRPSSLDPELPGFAYMDGSFLAPGDKFPPYPYSLIASNGDGPARSGLAGESGSGPVAGGGPMPDRRLGAAESSDVTAIPEPATSGLLAMVCAVLAVSAYRRMTKAAPQFK